MTPYSWVPLVLLIIFVIFFPVGWGSITYILVSELVPTMVRTETAVLCNSWEQLLQVRELVWFNLNLQNVNAAKFETSHFQHFC